MESSLSDRWLLIRTQPLSPPTTWVLDHLQPPAKRLQMRLGQVLLTLGQMDEAQAYIDRALANAEQRRRPNRVALQLDECATIAFYRGDWASAHRYIERPVAQQQQVETVYWPCAFLYLNEAWLHLAEEQVEAASQTADAGRAREQYSAALAILSRLGERLYAVRIEQALAEMSRQSRLMTAAVFGNTCFAAIDRIFYCPHCTIIVPPRPYEYG